MPPRDSDKPAVEDEASSETSESESDEDSSSDEETEKDKNLFSNNPSLRNARDMALIAEERWLIEQLKSIRRQRNSLKVEALYYQGLKAELYANYAQEFGETAASPPTAPPPMDNDIDVPIPELTYPNEPLTAEHRFQQNGDKNKQMPSNLEDFAILEGECNSEALEHLSVNRNQMETWDIEDPEYESEEEEPWNRVNFDMSMLVGYNDGDI